VYVVIDNFSGMIVGLCIGLEGPSWNGARQALFNAFTSKVQFCATNGVTIDPEEWACQHLPHHIYADRGEMLGKAAEGLASGLNIEPGIAPPYRPDWKSMVESRFGILNDLTGIRWLPGGVAAREKERGERDYRLDSTRRDVTLSVKEFTKIIIQCVLHYKRFNRQPDRLTQEMMSDGVDPTPVGIWTWALENGHVEPNNHPDELVYLHLLPREQATAQKGGYSEGCTKSSIIFLGLSNLSGRLWGQTGYWRKRGLLLYPLNRGGVSTNFCCFLISVRNMAIRACPYCPGSYLI
jgi:hypothetical protein